MIFFKNLFSVHKLGNAWRPISPIRNRFEQVKRLVNAIIITCIQLDWYRGQPRPLYHYQTTGIDDHLKSETKHWMLRAIFCYPSWNRAEHHHATSKGEFIIEIIFIELYQVQSISLTSPSNVFVSPRTGMWIKMDGCFGNGNISVYTGAGSGEEERKYLLRSWQ